jgi:hypothetical protein
MYQGDFEKYYLGMTSEEREGVDRKVMQIWTDHTLNDNMIRAVAFKLLASLQVDFHTSDI